MFSLSLVQGEGERNVAAASTGALIPMVILPPGHARRLHAIAVVCDQISQHVPFTGPSRRSRQTHSPPVLCSCVCRGVYTRLSCARNIPKQQWQTAPLSFVLHEQRNGLKLELGVYSTQRLGLFRFLQLSTSGDKQTHFSQLPKSRVIIASEIGSVVKPF